MPQPPPPPFRGSKAALLRLLKERRQATVTELAGALELTRACVHSHLADLVEADMVRLAGVLRSGRGRPEHSYELSEGGEGLFPKDYAGLASDLLELVKARYGQGAALELLERRNAALSRDWRQGAAELPLRERLECLAAHLCDQGFEARVIGREGETALVLGNCPYPKTAAAHPEICAAERRLHEAVLGAPVRRVSPRIVEGHGCCKYVPEEDMPKKDTTLK